MPRAARRPSSRPPGGRADGRPSSHQHIVGTVTELDSRYDVVIVGCGPTGLVTANLLGDAGLSVLVLERNPATSSEAKAISLDDESLRTMNRAGLRPWLHEIVVPGTGTRYYDRRRRPLWHAHGPTPTPHGHAIKSPFAQPELEAALLDGLSRFPQVAVEFSSEVTAVRQTSSHADALVRSGAGERWVQAGHLLGCDGARSTVREQLGITMRGSSFSQRWIVIDTIEDQHDERYGIHCGDPDRPFVIIPGRDGRCRYEFPLRDDEASDGVAGYELIARLLAEHRALDTDQVERVAVYRFHALVAERWGVGRCFLLGDAAHMMPPFAGQGLNSGVRDANNLAWKLIAVAEGRAGAPLLETYELERRPHAEATIRLSVRLGEIVMTTSPVRALVRDLAIRAALRVPHARRWLEEMRFRPTHGYQQGFVARLGADSSLPGTALGQPRVLLSDGSTPPLDDVLGPGFALLAVEIGAETRARLSDSDFWDRRLKARRVSVSSDRFPRDDSEWLAITDDDGTLRRLLAPAAGRYVLVRPDRFVAAVFDPGESPAVVADLSRRLGEPTTHSSNAIPPAPDPSRRTLA